MAMRLYRLSALAIAAGALCVLVVVPANRAAAGNEETYNVNLSTDQPSGTCPATCTLRHAIIAANNHDGLDNITFAAGVTNLAVDVDMTYIDASDGINIDGGDHYVTMDCGATCAFNFGLVFVTDTGVTAQNITIRKMITARFLYDGMQVCAGVDYNAADCFAEVSNVSIQDSKSNTNGQAGIRILGDGLSGISVGTGTLAQGNGATGLLIQGHEIVTNVSVDNTVSMLGNGVNGLGIIGEGGLNGVTISGGQYNTNGGRGLYVHAQGTAFNTHVSAATANGNGFAGVELSSLGGSMPGTTVTGVTANQNTLSGVNVDSSAGLGGGISGSSAANNGLSGIAARGGQGLNTFEISGNTVDNNQEGIFLQTGGQASAVTVENNEVTGSTDDGMAFSSFIAGMNNVIRANTVTGSGAVAIHLVDKYSSVISRNITHTNGRLGIDLFSSGDVPNGTTLNDPGDGDTGPNDLLNFPVINAVDAQHVTGTACANCLIEVFASDADPSNHGESPAFLGDGTANAQGEFSVTICTDLPGLDSAPVTATATQDGARTSEFADNVVWDGPPQRCTTPTPSPTSSPSPTLTHSATPTPSASQSPSPTVTPTNAPGTHKQGDFNCDGEIDATDALLAILARLGLTLPAGECPLPGSGDPPFGDVNCDDAIDERDGLAILGYLAQTPLPRPIDCLAIGATLP